MYTTMMPQSQTTSSSPYNGHSPSYYSDQNSGNSSSTSISSPSMYSYSSSSNTSPTSITNYPTQTMQNNGMVSNIMDFYIHDVNFSLHTKASPECEIQLYRLTNPMDAQITFVNTHPQSTPPPHLSTVVYALQIQLEKFISQTNQWVPCTNDTPSSNLFKDYEANVMYNQTNNQSITQLIQTDGKSLYIQLPLQLGLFCNQYTSMTFRSKLNTSKEKQGFKRGEVAIFRVVFTLLKQQQQLHTYFQNKYDSVPFGIINHGKNSTAVGMYKNIKLSSIPGTVENNMLLKQQQQQQTYTPLMHSPNTSIYTTPNTSVGTSDYSNNSPYGGNQYNVGYNGQSMGIEVIDESRQIQEMLDILNQEEEMARQYYNSNSSNDSGSGDDIMYMTDDEDMFREINSMEDYFSQSQETNTSPGQSDQNNEDIKWEDDPNEDFHGFTTQSDAADFLYDDESEMESYYADYSAPSPMLQTQSAVLSSSTLFKSSALPHAPQSRSASTSSSITAERRSIPRGLNDSYAPPPPVMRKSSYSSMPPTESRNRSSLGNTIQASVTPSINQYETWSSPIVSDSRQELSRSVSSQPSQPPRMTFGAHYIRSDVAELKQPPVEKKKKMSLGKLFQKKSKEEKSVSQEKEKEEKAKNPLSNQSHASFFSNFKPSTMVTLNTNQLPDNVRQVSKVTQAQQKPTEDSASTTEDELAETLSKLNISNTSLTTKFDPKKIIFTLEKKGSSEVYDLSSSTKEKKAIPSFNPGDIIQFSVKNNNEKEFIEKTNLIVGTTIPRRSIVTFSDKSTGFTQMKDNVVTSQSVQIPNIRVTNPTCKKKAKIVTVVLFVKFIESGKERIFTTKRRIMVLNK